VVLSTLLPVSETMTGFLRGLKGKARLVKIRCQSKVDRTFVVVDAPVIPILSLHMYTYIEISHVPMNVYNYYVSVKIVLNTF
jgi:hypothetical protein